MGVEVTCLTFVSLSAAGGDNSRLYVACGTRAGTVQVIDLLGGHTWATIRHDEEGSGTCSNSSGDNVMEIRQLKPMAALVSLHQDGRAFIDWLQVAEDGSSCPHVVTLSISAPHRPFTPKALHTSPNDPTIFALSCGREVLILSLAPSVSQEPLLLADLDLGQLDEDEGDDEEEELAVEVNDNDRLNGLVAEYLTAFSGASQAMIVWVHNKQGRGAWLGWHHYYTAVRTCLINYS